MKGRVILLEPLSNTLDTSSLDEFGEVAVIFGSNNGKHQTPSIFRTQEYVNSIQEWLAINQFDPHNDKFVLSGRLSKIAVAVAALTRAFNGCGVKVLIYDGGSSQYVERTI